MNKVNAVFAGSLLLLGAGQACAEGWFWQSQARVFTEQNDNVRLSTNDAVDAASIGVAAQASISLEDEDSRVSLTPKIISRRYSSDEDFDNTSIGVNGDVSKIFERSAVGIEGGVTRDSTLTSEYEDSGRLRNTIDRVNAAINPYYRFRLTPLSSIRFQAGYRTVEYKDGAELGYYDYRLGSARLSYELDLTRRDQVTASLYAADFEADGRRNNSTSAGVVIALQHELTERTSFGVSLGGYNLDSEIEVSGALLDHSNSGSSYGLSMEHKAPLTSFRVSASSKLEPSSTGVVRQTDRGDVSIEHRFTPRFSARAAGVALRNESTDSRFSGDDRDYMSGEASLAWHMDRLWSLRGSYLYASQEYDVNTESATSSRIAVSVEFNSLKSNF